ncbi:MarR family winged helix-turn-helix transcriptional regulator [Paenibacillus elgii]|uniref:MarR family winged helix-turn-helix transcriptional regulator n=1 Tax=Paenibacillus elgii TaxID=189691 RepID=UPI0020425739|nr:MarR family transcriptional regulator [Paenibacillus elgii]MCM3273029.1 MarR family transcriptional regulator [Paenibacillus elgii]
MNEELIRYVKEINKAEYDTNVMLTLEYAALVDETITDKQLIVLSMVHEHGRLNTGEIADKMGITPSAVSQFLGKLEKTGYIKRSINPSNRREIIVELDQRGTEYMARNEQIERSIIERYYSKLGMDDILTLRNIVLKLRAIVEEEQAKGN